MSFFSIIIPVYNVMPYLRECLDSVLAQTFTDWEAICVDDGSSDGSGAILDEYAAKDSRFRVIHQSNAGVSAARNVALDGANGEWFLFLDGDDVWCSRLLRTVREMIEAYSSEKLLRFGFKQFEYNFRPTLQDDIKEGCDVIDIKKEISMRDFYDYLFWCYAYSRTLFDGIRFPKYIRGEDRCVLNRIQLERVTSIVVTNAILYGYRQRNGSAVNSMPTLQVLCDEMDHRLDIIEMIDASEKEVEYKGNLWLEVYLTCGFYHLANSRHVDRKQAVIEWRKRLCRLRHARGITVWSRFAAWTCPIIRLKLWDAIVFRTIQALMKGRSLKVNLQRRICKHGK